MYLNFYSDLLAQWESTSLTGKGSWVRIPHRSSKSIDNISYQCFFSSIRELLNLNTKEMEGEKMGEHGKNLKNII
jgi:hypothetical protein